MSPVNSANSKHTADTFPTDSWQACSRVSKFTPFQTPFNGIDATKNRVLEVSKQFCQIWNVKSGAEARSYKDGEICTKHKRYRIQPKTRFDTFWTRNKRHCHNSKYLNNNKDNKHCLLEHTEYLVSQSGHQGMVHWLTAAAVRSADVHMDEYVLNWGCFCSRC